MSRKIGPQLGFLSDSRSSTRMLRRGAITGTAEPVSLTLASIATRIESSLFVLPVAINTPEELRFVAREATGGGPPKARFSLETLRLPPSSLD